MARICENINSGDVRVGGQLKGYKDRKSINVDVTLTLGGRLPLSRAGSGIRTWRKFRSGRFEFISHAGLFRRGRSSFG